MSELLLNFWQLFLVSAPWLLLGLILAGLLNVFIPKDLLQRHLGQEGFWTTVKAALIGAPMPLCSCGVIPAAVGLRRAGGSKSATTAFLVSTPETGVDSISVSYVLLGPFMAVIRPIAAICSAITAGVLVGREKQPTPPSAAVEPQVSCCAGGAAVPQASSCCDTKTTAQAASSGIEATASDTASCCATQSQAAVSCGSSSDTASQSSCCESKSPSEANGLITKLTAAIKFSCNKLLSDTAVWLLIGLFFAALVQTFVPESFLSQWGSGILAMTAMILISIPMYICATASTPIAAGLLLAGVSPGAVLVFMLAGPATNIATIGVVGKELGQRAVLAYLTGVIAVAVLFGFITDFLVERFGFVVTPMIGEEHQLLPAWLTLVMGLLLAALLLRLAILNLGKVVRR
ncbi:MULTISPECIES: SO_0444 family Cu/Zn efflux transporter [unclassified Pseudoalteromonas]|uniref:SO_0444 family Cu/Zn efflux transporter n=1 Tax=unclassified Pseudoalteromonas TaxID=194690 RepID=UPI003015365A